MLPPSFGFRSINITSRKVEEQGPASYVGMAHHTRAKQTVDAQRVRDVCRSTFVKNVVFFCLKMPFMTWRLKYTMRRRVCLGTTLKMRHSCRFVFGAWRRQTSQPWLLKIFLPIFCTELVYSLESSLGRSLLHLYPLGGALRNSKSKGSSIPTLGLWLQAYQLLTFLASFV